MRKMPLSELIQTYPLLSKRVVHTVSKGRPSLLPIAITLPSRILLIPEGWIHNQTSGIKRIRDGKVIAIGSKDGLPLDTVWTTLFDSSGYVWISSDKGIFRIPVAEIEDFGAGKIHSVHPVIYNTADGMKSSECNGGKPAGWRTSDGKLWFPTTQGVAVIDPKNIRVNVLPPPVYIDEVLMKGERVAREQAAHLAAGSRDLEFHYTALSLLVPDRERLKYKLEGYNRNWWDPAPPPPAYPTP